MIKLALLGIISFVMPILIGMLFTRFMKTEKNNLAFSWIIGYFCIWAICQIVAIPCNFQQTEFTYWNKICFYIFGAIILLSLIVNFKEFKNIGKNIIEWFKNVPKFLLLLVCIVVGYQCYMEFNYMHIDQDDSNFVAKATIFMQTNSLFKYTDIGTLYEKEPERRILSPFPLYLAMCANFTGYHPMAIAHTFFPVVFLLMMYTIYYLMGMKLFNNNQKGALLFVFFVSFVYMFGNVTKQTTFTFALVRLWQGKAVLGNVILPGLIVLYDSFVQEKTKIMYWFSIIFTMFASCFVSTMGFAMAPVVLGGLCLIYCVRSIIDIGWPPKLSFVGLSTLEILNIVIKTIICVIPNFVYAYVYSNLKGVDIEDEFFN